MDRDTHLLSEAYNQVQEALPGNYDTSADVTISLTLRGSTGKHILEQAVMNYYNENKRILDTSKLPDELQTARWNERVLLDLMKQIRKALP